MIEAVVPLTLADLERFQILALSIGAHFRDLSRCWVVVPDAEHATIAAAMPDKRFVVVRETHIVPELAGSQVRGWYKQQLVKLAMADHVATDYYLLFDADVICARKIRREDLFHSGKAICHRYRNDKHSDWYGWAERVLGSQRSGLVHGVTPAMLSKYAVQELAAYLENQPVRPGGIWPRAYEQVCQWLGVTTVSAGFDSARWRRMLLASLPWTEYALYFTFLESTGRFDRYHAHAERSLCGESLWRRDHFEQWRPSIRRSDQPPFMVVQSILKIPPQQILDRVEPLLRKSA